MRVFEGSWLVVTEEHRAPITADTAGWRKWCEENPEKCGGGPKEPRAFSDAERAELKALTKAARDVMGSSPEERAVATAALGRRALELGVPSRSARIARYEGVRDELNEAQLDSARRTRELRNTPGMSAQEMDFADFMEAARNDPEYVRRKGVEDAAWARAQEVLREAEDPSEVRDALERAGVVFGPGDREAGPEIRRFNVYPNNPDLMAVNESLQDASANVPTRWLERMAGTKIEADEWLSRAHYKSDKDEIHVNPKRQAFELSDTLRHEMMHAYEAGNPTLNEAQRGFLAMRGADFSRVVPINDLLDVPVYGAHEVAVDVGFRNPYSGRIYENGHYEVLSTGMEALFSRDTAKYNQIIDGDREFEEWLIGMLVASAE